jgi:hypothetical protein
VHSRIFWDLFAAITVRPRQDVVFLSQLLGAPQCFRELVIGQLLDKRIGYWTKGLGGEGVAFEPRTMPFLEEVGDVVSALRAGLFFSFKAQASSLHASFHARAGEQDDDGDGVEVPGAGRRVGLERPHLTLLERATRRILNAAEFVRAAHAVGFRVATVDWAHLSLQEEVTWMGETDALCGIYGVGLIKMAFARPRTVLLEVLLALLYCTC